MVNPIVVVISLIIATAVPLFVLAIIRSFDQLQTGSFRLVIMSFAWGFVAYGLSYLVNTFMVNMGIVSVDIFLRFTAPITEEILKGLILLYLIQRADFTYFVDGAIYGFAVGIGFAVIENFQYVLDNSHVAIGTAVGRVLSTNLIHATGSALVGVSAGLARNQKRRLKSLAVLFAGLFAAMAFHVAFNNLVTLVGSGLLLLYAAIVGFIGTGTIVFLIQRGLKQANSWVGEKVSEVERIAPTEAELVRQHALSIEELLVPVAERFGEDKARHAQKLVLTQARLGILIKNRESLGDERLRRNNEQEIEKLQEEMEDLQDEIGYWCMLFLREMFPPDSSLLQDLLAMRIQERAERGPASGGISWQDRLGSTLDKRAQAAEAEEESDPSPEVAE